MALFMVSGRCSVSRALLSRGRRREMGVARRREASSIPPPVVFNRGGHKNASLQFLNHVHHIRGVSQQSKPYNLVRAGSNKRKRPKDKKIIS